MQKLYLGENTEPVLVIRSFSTLDDGMVCEFPNGSYGYPKENRIEPITSPDQVSFLPEPHKTKALKWLKLSAKEREKMVDNSKKLDSYSIGQLQKITGSGTKNRAELTRLALEKMTASTEMNIEVDGIVEPVSEE